MTLIPAQIKKQFKQLKVRFIQADKLPQMDNWGSIDFYVLAKFQGKEVRTDSVKAQGDICPIMQEWWLPLQWPLSSDRLVMQLKDEDTVSDELFGSMFFSLKDLVTKGSVAGGYYYWQNLYGAPTGYSGENADKMNDNPELASAWMGRMLMHIECEDSKHPERKT